MKSFFIGIDGGARSVKMTMQEGREIFRSNHDKISG